MATRFDQVDQIRALTRTFLARFFENEVTTGTDDLKTFFFWILAFLAAPGFLLPVLMGFRWQLIERIQGPEALLLLSRADKTLYIGFVMIATAIITAIAWNSLIGDRRDALVLGALPVRPRNIVCARLIALTIYMLGIGVSMNALSSVTFGMGLAGHYGLGYAMRVGAAHFVATVSASACVFLCVTAAQGVVLAALGPRMFSRIAPVMQIALVGTIVGGFLSLPLVTGSVVDTLAGHGRSVHSWVLWTPPLWFLGVYDWLQGTSTPLLRDLAGKAVAVLGAGALVTVAPYPMAYRRVVIAAIEQGTGQTKPGAARMVAAGLTRAMGRSSQVRAVTQFFLAVIGRVEAHRFIIAATVGLVAAWIVPGWLSMASARPEGPRVLLVSISYSAMAFLVYGLNTAAALPADQKSAWMFDVTPPPRAHARAAMERTMFVFGVALPMLLFLPLYGSLWGGRFAIVHGAFMAVAGIFLIELALRRHEGMPCAQPWDPEGMDLGHWWWAYLIGFIVYSTKVPDIELSILDTPRAIAAFVVIALAAAGTVRWRALRREIPEADTSAFAPGDVLSLN